MEERRLGRPSRIFESFREGHCPACGDWIREAIFRAHIEREHPRARREEFAAIEVREVGVADRIAELVEAGNYLEDAAAYAGVGGRSAERWMEIGRAIGEEFGPDAEPDEIPAERRIFWRFWREVTRAREAASVRHLRIVQRAASHDWRAAAWILERTRATRFGKLERLHVGGDADGRPVRVIHEEADPNFVEDVTRIYRDAGVIPDVDSAGTNGREPAE